MDRPPRGARRARPDQRLRLPLTRALLAALLALAAAPVEAASPFGRWLAGDGSGVIETYPCGADLCGRIVGMKRPRGPDGAPKRDHAGRPMCGLPILQASPAEAGAWAGKITDPENGTAWNCTVRMDDRGRLLLRGYVLTPLLGQTQTWPPFGGTVAEDCGF